jgi:hypothetical protein
MEALIVRDKQGGFKPLFFLFFLLLDNIEGREGRPSPYKYYY